MNAETETVVPYRQNPREILDPVVESVFCIERGLWEVTAKGNIYRDVMVGGLYMEGFRVGTIEHISGDEFMFEVIENYNIEDREKFMENENGWDKARKKPVQVEYRGPFEETDVIETIEGDFEVDEEYIDRHGGYVIIKGVDGEIYPCGLDIFEKTYEKIG